MESVAALFDAVLSVFQIDFTLFGFTFSLWDVFIWTFLGGILLLFIGRLFHDD